MEGKIISSSDGQVRINIACHSACARCAAHQNCGFAESKDKEIVVDNDSWQEYKSGDTVEVEISERLGLTAVLVAYLLPALLAVAFFVAIYNLAGELLSALLTLAFFALYCGVLWLFRDRLQRHFTYTLSHKQ